MSEFCVDERHARVREIASLLDPDQRSILTNMSDGYCVFPIPSVAVDAQVPLRKAQRIFLELRTLGLAEFGQLYNEDTGQLRGRGYWRSELGNTVMKELGL